MTGQQQVHTTGHASCTTHTQSTQPHTRYIDNMNMVFSEKIHEHCARKGKSNVFECIAELLEVAVENLSILELLRGRQVIVVEKASVNCRVRQSSGRLRHDVVITLPSDLYNKLKDRHYVSLIIVL